MDYMPFHELYVEWMRDTFICKKKNPTLPYYAQYLLILFPVYLFIF